ncbi:MAG: hypothetical protein ACLQU1_09885 [Bryobacteraceae bacterium]
MSSQAIVIEKTHLGALAAIHLPANAALLWLGYYWLGVGESRTATLLWSAFLALLLACLVCWLHSATFACLRGAALPDAFRKTLRHLLPVLLLAVAMVVLYSLLTRWADYSRQPAFTIASYLTLKLRKPVKPAAVLRVFDAALWLMRWMVLPVFLLPLISGVAARGWAGFGEIARHARAWRYWIAVPVLLVCAFWLPFRLLGWTPHLASFAMQMISFSLRLLAAYLLFVGAWLLLAFFTAGGRPVRGQSKSVAAP